MIHSIQQFDDAHWWLIRFRIPHNPASNSNVCTFSFPIGQFPTQFYAIAIPLHLARLLLLEFLQGCFNGCHGFGPFGAILGKQILLATRPNLRGGVLFGCRCRDNHLDGIVVDAIFNHFGLGVDPSEGLQGCVVFLLAAVSVLAL